MFVLRERMTCLRGHFAQYDFKKSPPFWKSAMKLWIIQCLPLLSHAPSQNFVWHLLWLLITEGKLFNSLFHSAYLVFLINLISIKPICLPCIICGTYAMRITLRSRHSSRVTCLVYAHMYLHSFCNFQLKQTISVILSGRCSNNNVYVYSMQVWRAHEKCNLIMGQLMSD